MMSYTILLIDDDAQFRKLMELRLRSFLGPAQCLHHGSIQEARSYLTSKEAVAIDLVVLDHHLADGKGLDLLKEGALEGMAVLTMSSDPDPEILGEVVKAGAAYFLPKSSAADPTLKPLVLGLIERNRLVREVQRLRTETTIIETVKTLVDTLRHEINNPLGAVLGAAYILKTNTNDNPQLAEAARLVEESGQRIKHVLQELSKAVSLESVSKASQVVFHIPGDEPWEPK